MRPPVVKVLWDDVLVEARKIIIWATDHAVALFEAQAQLETDFQTVRFQTLAVLVRESLYVPPPGWDKTDRYTSWSPAARVDLRDEALEWLSGKGLEDCCADLDLDPEWVRQVVRRIPSVPCWFGWKFPDAVAKDRQQVREAGRRYREKNRAARASGSSVQRG